MALVSLTLLNTLRPWHDVGLTCFLLDDSLSPTPAELIEGCTQDRSFVQAQKVNLDVASLTSEGEPSCAFQASGSLDAVSDFQKDFSLSAPDGAGFSPVLQATAPSAEPQQNSIYRDFRSIAVEDWPDEWQIIYRKTKPAPILWTYAELGEDVTGVGCQNRADHLRHLIGSLRLPKGSSMFWPFQLPTVAGKSALSLFYSGICLLAPKVCISLGAGSASFFPYPFLSSRPFTQHIAEGRLHIFLPDFAELLASRQATQQASVFLSSALSAFPTLLP